MLLRYCWTGWILFSAAVLDLWLPIHLPSFFVPSCLLLVFLLFWGTMQGAEFVFWAGATGLLLDLNQGAMPACCTLGLATLALLLCRVETMPAHAGSRMLARCVLLLPAVAFTTATQWWGTISADALSQTLTLLVSTAALLIPLSLLWDGFHLRRTNRPVPELFRL